MAQVFYRKRFSSYLGEQRAIDDIITSFVPDGPVPSPTPSPTPGISATPTPTPSITPTITPTPTITNTPSITPTNTGTPTPTPTRTPAPACDITYTELPSPTPSPTPTITPSPGPAFDPDAATYLTAVVTAGGSVDSTMSAATNNMFLALKSNGLYTKIDAMYPVLGGTVGSHKFNAINPIDTNGAYRLTFTAGWTHSSTGMLTNGGQFTYADTYYDASVVVSGADDQHISIYTTTLSNRGAQDVGSTETAGGVREVGSYTSFGGNQFIPNVKSAASSYRTYVQPTQVGIGNFIATSTGTNVLGSKDGVIVVNNTQAPAFTNKSHYIGNSNGNLQPSNPFNVIFSTIGRKLTTGEMTTMDSIINAFQTALGRNTY